MASKLKGSVVEGDLKESTAEMVNSQADGTRRLWRWSLRTLNAKLGELIELPRRRAPIGANSAVC
jgi:hypothetical protein